MYVVVTAATDGTHTYMSAVKYSQGKRAEHVTQAILGEVMPAPTAPSTTTAPEPPAPPAAHDEACANGNLGGGGGGIDISSSNSELSDSEESAKDVGADSIGGDGGGGSDAGGGGGFGGEACEDGQEEGRLLGGDGGSRMKTKGETRLCRGKSRLERKTREGWREKSAPRGRLDTLPVTPEGPLCLVRRFWPGNRNRFLFLVFYPVRR